MDHKIILSIKEFIREGNNTVNNIHMLFGSDTVQSAINEGFISKNGNFIFLTEKGLKLTRPMENIASDSTDSLILS